VNAVHAEPGFGPRSVERALEPGLEALAVFLGAEDVVRARRA
jgi:hypothetical protein